MTVDSGQSVASSSFLCSFSKLCEKFPVVPCSVARESRNSCLTHRVFYILCASVYPGSFSPLSWLLEQYPHVVQFALGRCTELGE